MQMQSSGRQFLRQRHLKQEEDENDDNGGGDDSIEYDAIAKPSDEVKTSERENDDESDDGDDDDKAGKETGRTLWLPKLTCCSIWLEPKSIGILVKPRPVRAGQTIAWRAGLGGIG